MHLELQPYSHLIIILHLYELLNVFMIYPAREGAPCVFGGNVYRSGESFQSSCKYQCTCLDGAVGCVPLCGMDVRLPSPDCPMPRRVKVPGKCCEEWVCDSPPTTNSFMGSFLPGEEKDLFSESQICLV